MTLIRMPRFQTWWTDRILAMRRDRRRTMLLGLCYLLGIGWLDYVTGYEINLTVVYVTPLIMLTVAGGWKVGVATAFACAFTVEFTDWLAGKSLDHWYYHIFGFVSHSLSYLSFLLLITQLLSLWTQERDLAGRDPLTGLLNRYGFLGAAEETLREAARRKRPYRMVVLNVARMREVNARFGHDKADAMLQSVADALREALPGACLARMGGDRFAVLAEDQGAPGGHIDSPGADPEAKRDHAPSTGNADGNGRSKGASRNDEAIPRRSEASVGQEPGISSDEPASRTGERQTAERDLDPRGRVVRALQAASARVGVELDVRSARTKLPALHRTPEEIALALDDLLERSKADRDARS